MRTPKPQFTELIQWRESQNWSQQDLATRLNKSRTSIVGYEQCRSVPTLVQKQLAELGFTPQTWPTSIEEVASDDVLFPRGSLSLILAILEDSNASPATRATAAKEIRKILGTG